MIAITLVAGLSTGMLMAMRTSLLTYEKTANRLESNRRFVKTQQILSNQIAAVIPAQGCARAGDGGTRPTSSFLNGAPDGLRLITSYSIALGARGYPQIVEYRVLPGERGGVRLVATEHPYTGPEKGHHSVLRRRTRRSNASAIGLRVRCQSAGQAPGAAATFMCWRRTSPTAIFFITSPISRTRFSKHPGSRCGISRCYPRACASRCGRRRPKGEGFR